MGVIIIIIIIKIKDLVNLNVEGAEEAIIKERTSKLARAWSEYPCSL